MAAKSAEGFFREELAYFERHRAELLRHYKGDFVVIKGSELMGHFTTAEQAYEAGVASFGDEPFLLKEVLEEERPVTLSRLFTGMTGVHP